MSFVLRNQGKDDELSFQEMIPNASSLILAGNLFLVHFILNHL